MAHSSSRPQELPPLRHLLVVGGGGREQALGWALRRCPGVDAVWITPGNGGTAELGDCQALAIGEQDAEGLIKACQEVKKLRCIPAILYCLILMFNGIRYCAYLYNEI